MKIENGEKLLFIGDSVTDDNRARPVGEGNNAALGNGFVRLIDAYLAAEYPERNIHVVNMGVSGNTSRDLVERWESDVTAQNPDWVVLCIPQRAVPLDEYRKNLNSLADATRAKTIWMTPYYLEPNETDAMRKRMDEYRAAMKEIAAERGIPCIDLQEEFVHILQYRYPAFITWDRIHPGMVGSVIIAKAFLREIGFGRGR